jgi:hypothetical protein
MENESELRSDGQARRLIPLASARQVFPKQRVEVSRQTGGGGHGRVVAASRFPQDDTHLGLTQKQLHRLGEIV